MNPIACPLLAADQIFLDPVTPSDAQDLFDLWTCPEVQKLGGFTPPVDTESVIGALDYFKTLGDSGFFLKWVIRNKETNEFLGECELFPLKPQIRPWLEWEIGYSLKRTVWGQGIMTKAVQRMLQHAFVELNAIRVKADVMVANEKSFKLLERAGFEAEGIQRGKRLISETFQDMALMAITRNQYFIRMQSGLSD